jgi:phosphate transport system permease protein
VLRPDTLADPAVPRPVSTEEIHEQLIGSRSAGRADRAFSGLALGCGLLVLVILAAIALSTTQQAWPAFQQQGPSFFWSTDWNPAAGTFGAGALIFGTLVVSFIALLIGVPMSLGIALFVTELGNKRGRGPMGLIIDLLAAVPSVVYGLWALNALGEPIAKVYDAIAGVVGSWPVLGAVFGPPVTKQDFMTTGIVLAIMITPIITSLSREVILTVPSAQREAALALGATRWEMIRGAVFPWARSGITGAVLLGLGRAMGETIAVALIIGNSARVTANMFGPGDAMASTIANQWGEADGVHRSALIGLGVALFLITIVVNFTAQRIIQRFEVAS